MKVNVIKNFTGLRGELVEVVERKGTQVRRAHKRGAAGSPQHGVYRVSYKGEIYHTFPLSANYGDISGLCIAITYDHS